MLVDTAGIRRQAKVQESVEYYTTLRSQRAAERADVALVVCDATDGVTAQDLRIAELAMKAGCATALVLNKWDLTGGDEFDLDARARPRATASCGCGRRCSPRSAMTGRNVQRLLREALSLADRATHRIPTPELNRFLGDVVAGPPAAGEAGPPAEDALHGPDRGAAAALLHPGQLPSALTRDYAYFVENRLRDRYGLDGIPLIIDFAERKRRRRADVAGRERRAAPRSSPALLLAVALAVVARHPAATPPPPDDDRAARPAPTRSLYAHLSTRPAHRRTPRLLALAGRFSAVRAASGARWR